MNFHYLILLERDISRYFGHPNFIKRVIRFVENIIFLNTILFVVCMMAIINFGISWDVIQPDMVLHRTPWCSAGEIYR